VTSRYGPEKARRMLRCRTCKARFSERKGTPMFDSRLPPGTAESVLEHVAEGCGVRQTGRLCKVNRGTVGRLSRLAGEQARDLHDELGPQPKSGRSSLCVIPLFLGINVVAPVDFWLNWELIIR